MPVRAFPLPFSVGIDICQVSRITPFILGSAKGLPSLQSAHKTRRLNLPPSCRLDRASRLQHFFNRVFTKREQTDFWLWYCLTDRDFDPNDGEFRIAEKYSSLAARRVAGRFAAKEAIIKAVVPLGRACTFGAITVVTADALDVEGKGVTGIVHSPDEDGNYSRLPEEWSFPEQVRRCRDLANQGEVRRHLYRGISGQSVRLNISHDGDYAAAVCIAAEEGIRPRRSTDDVEL